MTRAELALICIFISVVVSGIVSVCITLYLIKNKEE